jgi:hypothetical protein
MKKSKSKFINNISLRQVNRGTKQIERLKIVMKDQSITIVPLFSEKKYWPRFFSMFFTGIF